MESDAAGAYLLVFFGVAMILFGLKNLIAYPAIGLFSLAAMAVYFGGLISCVGMMLRRPGATEG